MPLLYAALAACGGVLAAVGGVRMPWWTLLLASAAALVLLAREQRRAAAAVGMALCLAAGVARAGAVLDHPPLPPSLVRVAAELQPGPRQRVFLAGYLRDAPDPLYEHGKLDAVRLDLEAVSLARDPAAPDLRPVSGGVRMYSYTPTPALLALRAGQGIAVSVHLRPIAEYHDPGVPDFGRAARLQGIALTATVPVAGWRLWPVDHAGLLLRLRARAWRWLGDSLDRLLPPAREPAANALMRGMLLGDVARMDPATRENFEIDGTYHLLVVAGLHIGVLAGLLLWVFRRLRLPQLPASVLELLLLAAYAWVIAGRTPTLRALLMLAVYFLARAWHRERQLLNTVGAAALVLLAWRPLDLFAAGFQLSLGAALLLAGVALPLLEGTSHVWRQPRLLTSKRRSRGLRFALLIYEIAVISAVLQVGFAAFQALYFHRISPWSLLANAVLVFMAGVLIPFAWFALAVGHLATPLIAFPARVMLWVAAKLAHWPGAGLRPPSPPGWFLLLFALGVAGWLVAFARPGRRLRTATTAIMLALAVVAAWEPFPPRLPPGLTATILDVGQGDSIFVSYPDGRTMLVDGGPSSPHWDSGSEIVAPFLWSLGLHHLDAVVLTHAHMDHLGGLPAVVTAFHPGEIWLTRTLPTDAPTTAFLHLAEASGAHLRRLAAGDAFLAGASRLEVLLPPLAYKAGELASNDDSMVLRMHWGRDAMLLEGDAEAAGEHWMVNHDDDLASAVLKVGHHGSHTSSTPGFLAAVHPAVGVISVGAGNEYGHPAPATLAALAAQGIRIFRTDRDGAVQCRLQGARLTVELFRRTPGSG